MSMTRRDYQLIAETLAQAVNECRYLPVAGVGVAIEQFGTNLSAENNRYSKLQLIDDIQAMNVNPRAVDMISEIRNRWLLELPEVTEF
jgi:hypothetical protein